MYLEVSLLRGALQSVGEYKIVGLSLVGEQAMRLVLGVVLVVAGLSVTGAYLGSLMSYVALSVYCAVQLNRPVFGPSWRPTRPRSAVKAALGLWPHVKSAWVPIAGLAVIQLLLNIDLITAKHQFDKNLASSYAVAAVAAKVLIWVAMGAGFYLVPEVSRRRSEGLETRGVLLRSLGIIAVCAIPCLLIFAAAPTELLRVAFGPKRTSASGSLLPLGAAFTVLAATYLAVQYMMALRRISFLPVIGAVAVIEPVLLLQAPHNAAGFAAVVLGVQAVGAALAFALAFRRDSPGGGRKPRAGTGQEGPIASPPTTAERKTERVVSAAVGGIERQ